MSDHREAIAEVGHNWAESHEWRTDRCDEFCEASLDLADALLGSDVLAQIRAEARAEALREVADEQVEREHRWFEYGRWFYGFGSSMDPHICGEDGTVCEWRERTVTTSPWSDWTATPEGSA